MERMERIKNLNVRSFCAQGIVSADGCILICIASFPAAASARTGRVGFDARRSPSSFPYPCCGAVSDGCF